MEAKTGAQRFQEFWQSHSEEFLQMAFSRDRCRAIERPHGHGKKTGQCGDTVEFFVNLHADRLLQICYGCQGCLHTHACCNTVAQLAEGSSLQRAWEITPEDIAEYLQTLPPDHFHCAELAVGAFYLALRQAARKGFTP